MWRGDVLVGAWRGSESVGLKLDYLVGGGLFEWLLVFPE